MKLIKNTINNSWSYALYFLLWFPVTTLFQDLVNPINRLLFVIVVFFMAVSILDGEMLQNRGDLVATAAAVLVYLKALSYGIPDNRNMLFYFPFFVLFSLFISARHEKMANFIAMKVNYILLVIVAWTVPVVISIFLPSSYYQKWDSTYFFTSFTSSAFRLCPSALFIMVLIFCLTVFKNQKIYLLADIVPMFCMLMGGSRTYLVLGVLVLLMNWYVVLKDKKWFYISLIPFTFIFLLLISISSAKDKLAYGINLNANSLDSFLRTLSSGRSVFWSKMLNTYWDGDIMAKLFGGGLNFTVDVWGIWAHNDFIEILCAHGVLGVLVYGYFMCRLLHVFLLPDGIKKRRVPVWVLAVVILVWLFNACFNMYYTYFCAMASYPLMLVGMQRYHDNVKKSTHLGEI